MLNRLYLPKLKDNNIDGTFQLKSQKIKNKALVLIFEYKFSKKLKGIIIRKTFSFAPDGASFKVNCDIINNSPEIQTIGFWYWNTFTAGMWKNNPQIHIGGKSFTDRKYANSTTFYKTQKAPMVKNLLGSIDNEEVGDQKDIDLKSYAGNMILSSDSTDIAGFLNWAVNKKKFNTLELIFKAKVLKPNQTVSYPLIYKYIP